MHVTNRCISASPAGGGKGSRQVRKVKNSGINAAPFKEKQTPLTFTI